MTRDFSPSNLTVINGSIVYSTSAFCIRSAHVVLGLVPKEVLKKNRVIFSLFLTFFLCLAGASAFAQEEASWDRLLDDKGITIFKMAADERHLYLAGSNGEGCHTPYMMAIDKSTGGTEWSVDMDFTYGWNEGLAIAADASIWAARKSRIADDVGGDEVATLSKWDEDGNLLLTMANGIDQSLWSFFTRVGTLDSMVAWTAHENLWLLNMAGEVVLQMDMGFNVFEMATDGVHRIALLGTEGQLVFGDIESGDLITAAQTLNSDYDADLAYANGLFWISNHQGLFAFDPTDASQVTLVFDPQTQPGYATRIAAAGDSLLLWGGQRALWYSLEHGTSPLFDYQLGGSRPFNDVVVDESGYYLLGRELHGSSPYAQFHFLRKGTTTPPTKSGIDLTVTDITTELDSFRIRIDIPGELWTLSAYIRYDATVTNVGTDTLFEGFRVLSNALDWFNCYRYRLDDYFPTGMLLPGESTTVSLQRFFYAKLSSVPSEIRYNFPVCLFPAQPDGQLDANAENDMLCANPPIIITDVSAVQQEEASWKVFPNPTRAAIWVEGGGHALPQDLYLMDMTGRVVRAAASAQTLSVEGLPNGLYYLMLHTAKESVRLPVVVQQ